MAVEHDALERLDGVLGGLGAAVLDEAEAHGQLLLLAVLLALHILHRAREERRSLSGARSERGRLRSGMHHPHPMTLTLAGGAIFLGMATARTPLVFFSNNDLHNHRQAGRQAASDPAAGRHTANTGRSSLSSWRPLQPATSPRPLPHLSAASVVLKLRFLTKRVKEASGPSFSTSSSLALASIASVVAGAVAAEAGAEEEEGGCGHMVNHRERERESARF